VCVATFLAEHHPQVRVLERRDGGCLLVHRAAPVAPLGVLEVIDRVPLRFLVFALGTLVLMIMTVREIIPFFG